MSDAILAPVSIGEVLDKISILQIKSERITDERKLRNIENELRALHAVVALSVPAHDAVECLMIELKAINTAIWDVEDSLRDMEKRGVFDVDFIEAARSVYKNNDKRSALKREINDLTGSKLVEEKSYS
jgi:predicted  nucleic acid-binding Zn-ribbon protein